MIGALYRAKLTAAVRNGMHAELVVGSVFYRPPFTFLTRDVRIFRHSPDGNIEIIRAEGLDVTLAGIPRNGAPPTITRAVLYQPSIQFASGRSPCHVEQVQLAMHSDGAGSLAYELIFRDDPAATGQASGTLDPTTGVCQVQKCSFTARVAELATNLPWRDGGRQRVGDTEPHGNISISGSGVVPFHDLHRTSYRLTVDFDDVSVRVPPWKRMVDHGNGRILVQSGAVAPQSADWLAVESSLDFLDFSAGTAKVRIGGGKFTASPSAATWQLAELVGSVQIGNELPFELKRSGWFFEKGEFHGPLEFTAAGSGPFRVPAGKSPFEVIRHEVLAYPHGISIKPRGFAGPIEKITGGPIAFRGGVVTLQNLAGSYGADKLLLRSARLTLEDPVRKIKLDDLRTQVKFEEVAGTVIFQQPGLAYPGATGKTISLLRPTGPFTVGGGSWYAMNRPSRDEPGQKLKADFFVRLIGDGGCFAITNYKIPLTDIHGDATLAPLMVDISHFDAKSLGGTAVAVGKIVPGKPFLYQGEINVRDADLRQLASAISLREPARSRLSGIGYARMQLAGAGKGGGKTFADQLTANGEVEILHGDFWSVPTVQEVASQVRPPDQLSTGDAAVVFHIANRSITVQNAAVNSPLLGLQATGTVGFDKTIFLTVVAAPLGDWRDRMKRAQIPIVGDILGAVQKLLNDVQGVLLYQFRVTGTLAHPVKSIVPAPVISDPMALLFGQMLRQDRNGQLLNDVRGTGAPTSTTAQAQPTTGRQPNP